MIACFRVDSSTEIGTGTSYVNLDGVTGLIIPPKDSKALADAIVNLLSDESLLKKMGYASRLRYEELFTGRMMGQKYFDCYTALNID